MSAPVASFSDCPLEQLTRTLILKVDGDLVKSATGEGRARVQKTGPFCPHDSFFFNGFLIFS